MAAKQAGIGALIVLDEELVSQARNGSLVAFDELVFRHQDRVHALAYRIIGNREEAADIQQETFVRAWTCLKRFRGQSAFSTWLHRITVNMCISRKRRRDFSEPPVEFDEEQIRGHTMIGTACAERIHTTIAVREAMAAIPVHCRTLLVLREIEGRSCEEIAQIVGGSANSVRTRLSRARNMLREKMRPYLEEED